MPMYIGDYLRDTRHLSTLEHGAYFLLIMDAWTHGGLLPGDEKRLARIAGMSPKEWAASRDALLDFFDLTPDGYRHGRVDEELAKTNALNAQRSEAGKASAAKRWGTGNETDNETVTGVITDPSISFERNDAPSPSPSQDDIPKGTSSKGGKRVKLAAKPDDVSDDVWSDFQGLRRQKRAPLTETAMKGIEREAVKAGWTLDAALRECCERGWQGFKADWVNGNKGKSNGNGGRPSGWLS